MTMLLADLWDLLLKINEAIEDLILIRGLIQYFLLTSWHKLYSYTFDFKVPTSSRTYARRQTRGYVRS